MSSDTGSVEIEIILNFSVLPYFGFINDNFSNHIRNDLRYQDLKIFMEAWTLHYNTEVFY